MANEETTQEILTSLKGQNLFTDSAKAEVLKQILLEMPEEDVENIKKSLL